MKRKDKSPDYEPLPKKRNRNQESAPATSTTSFQQLLDFTELNATSEISTRFGQIARALLHDFHLVVRCGNMDSLFEIMELEFYLRKDGCHEDPFAHGSEDQKISGRW